MVLEASRAYADVKKWVRAGRPRQIDRGRFARRALGGTFVAGVAVMGVIALLAPDRFGAPGASTVRSGWPSYVVVGLVLACGALAWARHSYLRWLWERAREPLLRPLREHPSFEGALGALAACPASFHTRFAVAYVWGPALAAVLGTTFSFSAAYFLVDAVLARGAVGWGQPVYALASAAAGFLTFAGAAGKLATWRLAASVHREVTTAYGD